MSGPIPNAVCLPKDLISKYSPNHGEATITDSPHSLYFRCGPEVSNQIREFLASRGWQDLSYAQIHPTDYPTLILPDILEQISHSLRRFSSSQRITLMKSLQQQMNSELKSFLQSKKDPVTNKVPPLTNKHPITIPRTHLYYRSVPAIWNLWWEDQGFNPMNVVNLKETVSWNHIFTMSHIFRKDGLQKELMFYQTNFGSAFKDVIPRGWVLPTEHKQWNQYLYNLIKAHHIDANNNNINSTLTNGLNVVLIDPDGYLQDENTTTNVKDGCNNDDTKLSQNLDTTKPTVYISFSEDRMIQCTSYDPRIPQMTKNDENENDVAHTPTQAAPAAVVATNDTDATITNDADATTTINNTNVNKVNNSLPAHVINQQVWIAKPSGGARGEGIFVFNDLNKLNERINTLTKKKQALNNPDSTKITATSLDVTKKAQDSTTPTITTTTTVAGDDKTQTTKPDVRSNNDTTNDTNNNNNNDTTQNNQSNSPLPAVKYKAPLSLRNKVPLALSSPIVSTTAPSSRVFTGTLTVQEYINTNMLVGTPQYKFDLRLYVLIVSHFPLEIYIHRMGIVRIASSPYEDDINNTGAHLTNFTVGKKMVKKDEHKSNNNNNNNTTRTTTNEQQQQQQQKSSQSTSGASNELNCDKSNKKSQTESSAVRFDKRYDNLRTDQFDPTTHFSDGLKWTLDEFRSYINTRKAECDELGLEMKSFEQIWLDIKHLVLKSLIPSIPTQCYGRGGTPHDIYNAMINQFDQVEKVEGEKKETCHQTQKNDKTTVWEHLFAQSMNNINPIYRGYELLGIDIMLHNDGSPVLIEMNRSPAMVVQTPADYAKTQVLHDVFNMLQIEQTMLHAKRQQFITNTIDKKSKLGGSEGNRSNTNPNARNDDSYNITINGVDIPFNWRNGPGCFWTKYRPDYQLVTNSCPYPNTSLEQYPLDSDSDSDDDDVDDDDDVNNEEQNNNGDGEDSTTNTSIQTSNDKAKVKMNKDVLNERDSITQKDIRSKKIKKLQREIEQDYMSTSFDCFKTINTNVPQRVKKLIFSSKYKQQRQLQGNLDAKMPKAVNSNIDDDNANSNPMTPIPTMDLVLSTSNDYVDDDTVENDEKSSLTPAPTNNDDDNNNNNDASPTIEKKTTKPLYTKKLTQADIVKYPFAQAHNFERIYPLNICNYINGYFGYKLLVEEALLKHEQALVLQIEPFVTAKMSQLSQQQSQLLNEYERVQYTLCHIDHLIEYQYLQLLFTPTPSLAPSVTPDAKCSQKVSEFDQQYLSLSHPLRHIMKSKLFTNTDILPQLPPLSALYNPHGNTDITTSLNTLKNLAHLIVLTSQHAFHWYKDGFAISTIPPTTIGAAPSVSKLKLTNTTTNDGDNNKTDTNDSNNNNNNNNNANDDNNIHPNNENSAQAQISSQLPTLLSLDFTSTPIPITGLELVKHKPLDMRIAKSKESVTQYMMVIIRFLMWYYDQQQQ